MIKSWLMGIGLLLAGMGAAEAGPSSFQRSCNDIQIEMVQEGAWVTAQCADRQGVYRRTTIEIQGIHNDDGRLVYGGPGASSFQRSCDSAWLEFSPGFVRLWGDCRTRAGVTVTSVIDIENVHNDNGNLVMGW